MQLIPYNIMEKEYKQLYKIIVDSKEQIIKRFDFFNSCKQDFELLYKFCEQEEVRNIID